MQLEFSRQLFEKKKWNIKRHENRSSWSQVVPWGHKDGRTDMKVKIPFRNFANSRKNQSVNAVWGENFYLFWEQHMTHKSKSVDKT